MTTSDLFSISMTILASIGGAGVIILSLSNWLGKIWAERLLSRESARLEKEAFEHQLLFKRVYEKRAEILEQLYKLIVKLEKSLSDQLDPNSYTRSPETHDRMVKSNLEFERFYTDNKIYFSPYLCELLDDFSKNVYNLMFKSTTEGWQKEDRELMELQEENWVILNKKIIPLKQNIENEFRSILGVI